MTHRKTMILHLEWKRYLDRLSDAQKGRWLQAIFTLMETGRVPQEADPAVDVAIYSTMERAERDWESQDRRNRNLKQYRSRPDQTSAHAADQTAAPPRTDSSRSDSVQADETPRQTVQTDDSFPVQDAAQETSCPVSGSPAAEEISVHGSGQMNTPVQADPKITALYRSHFGPPNQTVLRGLAQAQADLGAEATRAILERSIANNAKTWSYLQTSFQNARAEGVRSVQDYEVSRLRANGALVDRPTPGQSPQNDFIRRAFGRPMQLKRKD